MTRRGILCRAVLGLGLAGAAPFAAAAPAAHATLQEQVQAANAKVAAAHERNTALQTQVSQLEQQADAQKQQLQQRDAAIAALQEKLRAAGVPVSASSTGG